MSSRSTHTPRIEWTCDRCGIGGCTSHDAPEGWESLEWRWAQELAAVTERREADLCPDCLASFAEWLRAGEPLVTEPGT